MKTFSFSDLNRHPGEVLDAALVAPVTLTKRGKAKLVMMNAETYERLQVTKAYSIADAPEELIEGLLEGLKEFEK